MVLAENSIQGRGIQKRTEKRKSSEERGLSFKVEDFRS